MPITSAQVLVVPFAPLSTHDRMLPANRTLQFDGAIEHDPPVVTWSPNGGAIQPSTRILVSITDATGLRRTPLWVRYSSGAVELVHDGLNFTDTFSGSTSTTITDGVQFSVSRDGGWPEAFRFFADPVDTSGNAE